MIHDVLELLFQDVQLLYHNYVQKEQNVLMHNVKVNDLEQFQVFSYTIVQLYQNDFENDNNVLLGKMHLQLEVILYH